MLLERHGNLLSVTDALDAIQLPSEDRFYELIAGAGGSLAVFMATGTDPEHMARANRCLEANGFCTMTFNDEEKGRFIYIDRLHVDTNEDRPLQ